MGLQTSTCITLIQLISIIFFLAILITNSFLLLNTIRPLQRWTWFNYAFNLQNFVLGTSVVILLLLTIITWCWHITDINIQDLVTPICFNLCILELNDLSLMFLLLIAFLFPVVIYLASFEFNAASYKFFALLLLLYFVIFLFILCNDLIFFYVIYEFMIALVFFIMYLSANTRGGIEATMLFLGWAVLGSMLVGLAVIYIIYTTGSSSFNQIKTTPFSQTEVYYLSILLFAGFGTKLSIWPFWYWLPRAHVEVSTSISIFLSCILIKICLYGFMRTLLLINQDILVSPLIFFILACIFDVVYRLAQQVDLKAVIAYSSVLHVNLLILLVLLNPGTLNLGLILYIWGHSYTTAGLFFAVHLIERCYGSRSTFEISGVYNTNPAIGLMCIMAVISCLEFPLNFYFWGEVWLWITLFSTIPLTAAIMSLMCGVVYVIVFFRIWWGVLFGASSQLAQIPIIGITNTDIQLFFYMIGIQYILGLQPSLFSLFIHT